MNPRIPKLKEERKRLAEKLREMQTRLNELDAKILELENLDILGIVRENELSIDQLADLMELLDKKPTANISTMEDTILEESDDEI